MPSWRGAGLCAVFLSMWSFSESCEAQTDDVAASFQLPSGSIPGEILGVPCKFRAGDADFVPMLMCLAENPSKMPSISVFVRPSECAEPAEMRMVAARSHFDDDTPFSRVVWEEPFSPPTVPNGIGFRGFYQKSLGNRYYWEVCGGGKLTSVLAIMYAPVDNEALKADIEMKIFGFDRTADAHSKDLKQ